MALTLQSIAVTLLLGLAVLVELLAVVGLVTMRTTIQRLHFVAPATCVGPVLVGIAVAIGTHATPSQGAKGVIIAVVLSLFSGVLSHETGLAATAREQDQ